MIDDKEAMHPDALRALLEQDVYRLEVLGQIKQAVLVDQSPRRFAETAFSLLHKVIPYDFACVILFDIEKEKGEVLAAAGSTPASLQPGVTLFLENCIASYNTLQDQAILDPALLEPLPPGFIETVARSLGFRDFLSQLLVSHNTLIGALHIASYRPAAFDERSVRIARDVADSLAVAIQKAMLFEQARVKAYELEALSKLSLELRRTESWDSLVAIIQEESEQALHADASLFLWKDGGAYRILNQQDCAETTSLGERLNSPDLPLGELLDQDRPVFTSGPAAVLDGIFPDLPEPQAAVLLPFKTGDRLVGKLLLGFQNEREFTVEDERLLTSIADIAGNALYRANVLETLEERIASRTRHLETLYNISNTINQTLDLTTVLERSLEYLEGAAGAGAAVHLLDEASQALALAAGRGLPDDRSEDVLRLAGSAAQAGRLVQVQQEAAEDGRPGIVYAGLPLKGRRQALGVLSLVSTRCHPFGEDSLTLLSGVADHLSIAVENDQLRRRAEDAIVIEERQRLARELHDSISQLLYSQLLFAQAGQRAYESGEMEMLPLYLNRLVEVAEQAFKEMRLMIYSLRPQVLESEGLAGALQHRLVTVERRTGLDAQLDVQLELKLPAAVEDSLFRIAQEALNNTLKHASATRVSVCLAAVRLAANEGRVKLAITDNGKGFDPSQVVEGVGFASMQERARQLGGALEIQSEPGKGTTIRANIPISGG